MDPGREREKTSGFASSTPQEVQERKGRDGCVKNGDPHLDLSVKGRAEGRA